MPGRNHPWGAVKGRANPTPADDGRPEVLLVRNAEPAFISGNSPPYQYIPPRITFLLLPIQVIFTVIIAHNMLGVKDL